MNRALLAGLALLLAIPPAQAMWSVEELFHKEMVGGCSIVTDYRGYPRIAFNEWESGELHFAHWEEDGWHVDELLDFDAGGQEPSLVLDSHGYEHIVASDMDNSENLYYLRWDGTQWIQTRIGENGGGYPSLVLDQDDRPHIVYRKQYPSALSYLHWDGADWTQETIATTSYYSGLGNLVLDPEGILHFCYWDYDEEVLKHARREGSTWLIETVVAQGTRGRASSLALSRDGQLWIAFSGPDGDSLEFGTKIEDGWQTEIVDSTFPFGHVTSVSLVLDEQDRAHIAYTAGVPLYARQEGASWYRETIHGGRAEGASLALDIYGRPHVAYSRNEGCGPSMQGWQFYTRPRPRAEYIFRVNRDWVRPGWALNLTRTCMNRSAFPAGFIESITLEYQGWFWFWPTWTTDEGSIPFALSPDAYVQDTLLDLQIPQSMEETMDLTFHGWVRDPTDGWILAEDSAAVTIYVN